MTDCKNDAGVDVDLKQLKEETYDIFNDAYCETGSTLLAKDAVIDHLYSSGRLK